MSYRQAEDHTGCRSCHLRTGNGRLHIRTGLQHWTIEDWKNVAWLMSLDFCCNIQMVRVRIWRKEHESMDLSLPCLNGQAAGGGVMVWGDIFLVPIDHRLNATVYLSIVADHVHPFMTTVYPSSDATSSRIMHRHKAQIISDWFLEHDNEFTFTQMASTVTRSQSNRASLGCCGTRDSHHGCAADNLQQLCDAIMTIWTKISEECFQHLVESMPRRIRTVLKTKVESTRY